MPYAKPTVSSRRRARTPTAEEHPCSHEALNSTEANTKNNTNSFFAPISGRRVNSEAPQRPAMRSRVDGGSHRAAKMARVESRTLFNNNNNNNNNYQHPDPEEELRLSQEFTSQCDAVMQRVHALLEKSQQQEGRIQRTLQESLERGASPQLPRAPPTTPASPSTSTRGTSNTNNNNNNNNNNNSGWIHKLLGRSPEVVATTPPARPPHTTDNMPHNNNAGNNSNSPPPGSPGESVSLFQRAIQRLSGRYSSASPTPTKTESPRRSRKSVAFKEPTDLETVTPPRSIRKSSGHHNNHNNNNKDEENEPAPRPSLVYPPAPPPSVKKQSPRRSRSSSSSSSRSEKDENNENLNEVKSDLRDVGAIIRDLSHNRAFRQLSKAELVGYAKQHHVTLTTSSSKKELFEVARRLAKDKVDEDN